MKTALRTPSGRLFASLLATLLLWLSVAEPLLDRGLWDQHPHIETGQNTTGCVRGHDHSICIQLSAAAPLAASSPRQQASGSTVPERLVAREDGFHFTLRHSPHASRAPPQV